MMLVISINCNILSKNIILDIQIDNSFIKKLNSYKYLGITIQSNLNWTEQIESLKT